MSGQIRRSGYRLIHSAQRARTPVLGDEIGRHTTMPEADILIRRQLIDTGRHQQSRPENGFELTIIGDNSAACSSTHWARVAAKLNSVYIRT